MISIENFIFRGLLYNEEYTRSVYPYLDECFFDGPHKILFKTYKTLFDEYNEIPTLEALAISLQKEKISDSEFDSVIEVVEYVTEQVTEMPNIKWLIDETEEYCRDKAIYNAIYQSISILDDEDSKLDKNAIPQLLDEALAVSFDTTIGMNYFEDVEKRHEIYTSEDSRIKLPLRSLNFLSNGGLKRKSLSAVLAATNVGKSSFMCFLAGELIRSGYNVLYISLEMSEEAVMERIDANLLDIKTDDVKNLKLDEFKERVKRLKNNNVGQLIVKEYPTASGHVGHFRHLLKELAQKRQFVPDVIFVDYVNICASMRYRSMSGVNTYSYVKAIGEELRGLAVETNTAVFTATQTNRQSSSEGDTPDMTSTSDSFGLPMTLDWFIALTTDEVLQDNSQQLVHLLKTRWGNKTSTKPQLVNINFDKMRYSDVDSTQALQDQVAINKPKFNNKERSNKVTTEIDWG